MRRTVLVAVLAVAVLLAGCSAGQHGDSATTTTAHATTTTHATTTPRDTPIPDGTPSGDDATTGRPGDGGTVDFYLSDRAAAAADFDRLNVTVTSVGFRRAGNGSGDGEWYGADVNTTVDLTRLRGENASKVGTFSLPNGTYTQVFVDVAAANGTLKRTHRRVTLPSGQLLLNHGFTVGDGSDTDFVFDVGVREVGEGGTYVLSPTVNESGTGDEIRIRDVGADPGSSPNADSDSTPDGDRTGDTATGDGDDTDEAADTHPSDGNRTRTRTAAEGNLTATFLGQVGSGRDVTVLVTWNGTPVNETTVVVTERFGGDRFSSTAYRTDADGTVIAPVSSHATAVTASVEYGNHTIDFEWVFDEAANADASG